MPSRILREGLLDSPRYWGAPIQARDLFIRLLLVADDFGTVSLAPVFIGRRCFNVRPGAAKLEKLYTELCRVDLLRIYVSGPAELPDRWGFLPRFRQTLRLMKPKHPMPPAELYADDHDAQAKFTQFKQLFAKMPSTRIADAQQMKRTCVPDLDLVLEVPLETLSKRNEEGLGLEGAGAQVEAVATGGTADVNPVFNMKKVNGKGNGRYTGGAKGPAAKALELGLSQLEGETPADFIARINRAYDQARSPTR